MLFNIDKKRMTRIPHSEDYTWIRTRLTQQEYDQIAAAINDYFDSKVQGGYLRSSFIPGNDWANTPYQSLYLACHQDADRAGLLFGLIVWVVMMERSDSWVFLPPDKDADEVWGMQYIVKKDD